MEKSIVKQNFSFMLNEVLFQIQYMPILLLYNAIVIIFENALQFFYKNNSIRTRDSFLLKI